jgi:two-component system, sensor histidine kinase
VLLASVSTVLDIAQIEAGKLPLLPERFLLNEMIKNVCDTFASLASQKDLVFQQQIDVSANKFVIADRGKLTQILSNLLGNAVKFTPAGRLVRCEAQLQESQLILTIQDTGIGIPESRIRAIFKDFEQADEGIARKYGGTGLGLSIVERFVQLMQGQIEVQSKIDEGTTFTLRLPLEIAHADMFERIGADYEPIWSSIDVLVVEDNEVNQAVVESILASIGIACRIADSGDEALAAVRKQIPDAVLMDLHMPGMSGFEATKKIHALPGCSHVPIIALSADALIDQRDHALSIGIVDYLLKPIDSQKLRSSLRIALQQRARVQTSPASGAA